MYVPSPCWIIARSADPHDEFPAVVVTVKGTETIGFAETSVTENVPDPLVARNLVDEPINPAPVLCAPETVAIAVNVPVESIS